MCEAERSNTRNVREVDSAVEIKHRSLKWHASNRDDDVRINHAPGHSKISRDSL